MKLLLVVGPAQVFASSKVAQQKAQRAQNKATVNCL